MQKSTARREHGNQEFKLTVARTAQQATSVLLLDLCSQLIARQDTTVPETLMLWKTHRNQTAPMILSRSTSIAP